MEKMKRKEYEEELARLHGELVKLQQWAVHAGLKVCVLFEGRDGAGNAMTRKTRGLVRSAIALIVPPLPAPSRPSKTTQILACSRFTHSWSFTSSPWSFPSSLS